LESWRENQKKPQENSAITDSKDPATEGEVSAIKKKKKKRRKKKIQIPEKKKTHSMAGTVGDWITGCDDDDDYWLIDADEGCPSIWREEERRRKRLRNSERKKKKKKKKNQNHTKTKTKKWPKDEEKGVI